MGSPFGLGTSESSSRYRDESLSVTGDKNAVSTNRGKNQGNLKLSGKANLGGVTVSDKANIGGYNLGKIGKGATVTITNQTDPTGLADLQDAVERQSEATTEALRNFSNFPFGGGAAVPGEGAGISIDNGGGGGFSGSLGNAWMIIAGSAVAAVALVALAIVWKK